MLNANRWIFVLILFLSGYNSAQTTSEKLKKEQKRLEKKISDTKSLLNKSKSNKEASLNELKIIDNQIRYRENLLRNYDNQIRGAELTVQKKEQQVAALRQKIESLKLQYKELLLFAYKHRSNYGKLMYLFTSDSYNQAKKRNKYLRRISEIQQKQFIVIQQNQKLIRYQIGKIEDEKKYKVAIIEQKKREREIIEIDREKQQKAYSKFKHEEGQLRAKLAKEESQKRVLRQKISAAIKREIAAAEARRKALAKAKEKNRPTEKPSAPLVLRETKEQALIGKNFEGNRGKLPWPVAKGNVTEHFGKNAHPTLKNVYTNNRGIDISSSGNAQVRCVFTGEVTSVLNIPGAGKVVIIKHGNYRTVYSNLKDTYVKAGDKIKTKKVIGSLITKPGETVSVAHFEVHKVAGSEVTCLNPSLWLSH